MIPELRLFSRRATVIAAVPIALVLAVASPASAHVEVSAENGQAGAGPATLIFSAESESNSAGIVSIKTQLPAGIAPAAVTLAGGPAGWALIPTADGFEIIGPDIGPGVDAEYSVTIAQLPADRTDLVFPTLQRYSDGREDAWIEPVTADVPQPDKPAPILTVAPAPVGPPATPTATAAAAPTSGTPQATAAPSTSQARSDAATQETAEDSSPGASVVAPSIVVLVALIGAVVWAMRRPRA